MDHERLPSVLAIPIREFRDEQHPIQKIHRLVDAAEIVTRFCTAVALAEVRRLRRGEPLPDRVLGLLRERIERPTFGQWRDMLSGLIEQLGDPERLVVPGLPSFVKGKLLPCLSGPVSAAGLVRYRNDLVHGGTGSRQAASEALQHWNPRVEDLFAGLTTFDAVQLAFVDARGTRLLHGTDPGGRIEVVGRIFATAASPGGAVYLGRDSDWLLLQPLIHYGRARQPMLGRPDREAVSEGPLVYYRAEGDRLLSTALGVDLPRHEDVAAYESFRALFRLGTRAHPEKREHQDDFEREIIADARRLVGRREEIDHAKKLIRETRSGVIWVEGPAGIGKSVVMARLADDLRGDPRKACRIAWNFKLSDRARCSREAFFRHAVARLSRWLSVEDISAHVTSAGLVERLRELLLMSGQRTAGRSNDRAPQVVFVLDGLDEIERLDPDFPRVLFEFKVENVVWVCAGRPLESLQRVFSPDACRHAFPGGIGPMTPADMRAMVLEEVGSLKYELLALDTDDPVPHDREEIRNRAVQAIVDRAEGLPLYVRFVIRDLLAGEFQFDRFADQLPASLNAYYRELLGRLAVGDVQALLTPLLVTIAWAQEPLDVDTLQWLMAERQVVPAADPSLLRTGLGYLRSMVREAPRSDGATGYELYHPTFQEYVTDDPAGILSAQNALAIHSFCNLATHWRTVPVNHPARRYAMRYGPLHLALAQRWTELFALVADPELELTARWTERGEALEGILCIEGILRSLDRHGAAQHAAGLATQLARIYTDRGDHDASEQWLRWVLDVTRFRRGRRIRAIAHHELASLALYRSDLTCAAALYRKALAECLTGWPMHTDEVSANLVGLAATRLAQYRHKAACRYGRIAAWVADNAKDARHSVAARRTMANAYKNLREYQRASEVVAQARNIAQLCELEREQAAVELTQGWLHYFHSAFADGAPAEAIGSFEAALRLATVVGSRALLHAARVGLAACALLAEETDGAERRILQLEGMAYDEGVALVALLRAGERHQRGLYAEAEASYLHAIERGESSDDRAITADARTGLGATCWWTDARPRAEHCWQQAIRVAESCSPHRAALVRLSIARCRTHPQSTPR